METAITLGTVLVSVLGGAVAAWITLQKASQERARGTRADTLAEWANLSKQKDAELDALRVEVRELRHDHGDCLKRAYELEARLALTEARVELLSRECPIPSCPLHKPAA